MASISEILMAQGEQAARARRARGGAWTPVVQQLANLPTQISDDRKADAERAQLAQMRSQQLQLGGQRLQQGQQELQASTQERLLAGQMAEVLNTPGIIKSDGSFDLEKAQGVAQSKGYQALVPGLIHYAQQHDSEVGKQLLQRAQTKKAEFESQPKPVVPKAPEPFTLNPGDVRFDANGKQIATVPAAEKPDTRSLQLQANDALKKGDANEYARLMKVLRDVGNAGRDPKEAVLTTADLTQADQAIVDAIKDYRQVLPSGIALTKGKWPAYLEAAHIQDPNFDQSQYQVRQKLKQSFSSGKDADNVRGLNTAVGHLGSLATAMGAMNNGNWESVNQAGNWLSTHLPVTSGLVDRQGKQTKVRVDFNAVKGELAGIFKATGATDQEIKSWESTLQGDPAAATPQARKAFIEGAVELMGSRMGANRQKYESGMGGKPFGQAMLSPHSRDILKGLGIDVNAIDPPGANQGGGPTANDPLGLGF